MNVPFDSFDFQRLPMTSSAAQGSLTISGLGYEMKTSARNVRNLREGPVIYQSGHLESSFLKVKLVCEINSGLLLGYVLDLFIETSSFNRK